MTEQLEKLLRLPSLEALADALTDFSAADRRALAKKVKMRDHGARHWKDPETSRRRYVEYTGSEMARRQRLQLIFLAGALASETRWSSLDFSFMRGNEPRALERLWSLRNQAWRRAVWRDLSFQDCRALLKADLPDTPKDDEYFLRMFELNRFASWKGLYGHLLDDRDLLESDIWTLFTIEGDSERSFANCDKSGRRSDGWNAALRRLCEEGHLSRPRLLRTSLESLERDFPAYRAQWFSRLHEDLAPTVDERAELTDLYLPLLRSPMKATVSLALKAVALLHKAARVDSGRLLEALEPAARVETKTGAKKVLSLLRSLGKETRLVDRAAALSLVVATHEATDVQEAALAVYSRLRPNEPVPDDVLEHVSPSVLAAYGGAAPRVPEPSERATLSLRPIDWSFAPALREDERVLPIESVDELLQRALEMAEGQVDVVGWELVADGFARLGAELLETADHPLLGPLLTRCRKIDARFRSEFHEPELIVPAQWVLQFIDRRAEPPMIDSGHVVPKNSQGWGRDLSGDADLRPTWQQQILGQGGPKDLWLATMESAVRDVRAARSRPLLSLPTHALFFVDPVVLEQRIDATKAAGCEVCEFDLRLARLRSPQSDAVFQLEGEFGKGWDLATDCHSGFEFVRTASIAPNDLETYARCFIDELAWNHAFDSAIWDQKFALAPFFDQDTCFGPQSLILLCVMLGAREEGIHGMGIDLAILAIGDARIHVEPLGEALAQAWTRTVPTVTSSDTIPLQRFAKTLAVVAGASELHAHVVSHAIEFALGVYRPKKQARDLGSLLDTFHELRVAADQEQLSRPAARTYLEGVTGKGKAKTLAGRLLALRGVMSPEGVTTIQNQYDAALASRSARWRSASDCGRAESKN